MKYLLMIVFVFGSAVACVRMTGAQDGKGREKPGKTEKGGQATAAKSKTTSAEGETEAGKDSSATPTDKVIRSEKEWRKLLTREQYRVLRMKGTEKPFRNKYDKVFEPGKYVCAACGQELFSSETKFDSGCGWPAFYAAMAGDRVVLTRDYSLGMVRTEVTCARCGSHLGHIFDDAPQTPTGQRYCINSVSLKFVPASSKDEPAATTAKEEKKAARRDKSPAQGEKPQRDKAQDKEPSDR